MADSQNPNDGSYNSHNFRQNSSHGGFHQGRGGRGRARGQNSYREREDIQNSYDDRNYQRGRGYNSFYNNSGGRYNNHNNRDKFERENSQTGQLGRSRGGFGSPNKSNQNNYDDHDRSRYNDRNNEDHSRDTSPDRQGRSRPDGKQFEDHHRDPSPDRSRQDHRISSQYTGQNSYNRQNQWNEDHSQRERPSSSRQDKSYQKRSQYNDQQGRGSDWNRNQEWNHSRGGHNDEDKDWNRSRGGRNNEDMGHNSWGDKSDIRLSKALSFLLRHGAERQGYEFKPGGFLYIDEILKYQKNLRDYTLEDIKRVVDSNDKQRFFMEQDKENGKWKIRANQGHTIEVKDLELTPILKKEDVPCVVHGTYMASWDVIKKTGLSKMQRNHIHFAAGEPGENGVISGMRSTCEVMIYIDIEKALADGFKFFRSANNVILCPGNENGVIPPKYFLQAINRYPRRFLEFDTAVSVQPLPVGGAGLVTTKSKKKKNKKKKSDRDDETQNKKEKMDIDDSAMDDAGVMFKEEEEVMEVGGGGAEGGCEEGEEFTDAKQEQEEDEYQDAEDGSDAIVESSIDLINISDCDTCQCTIDHLKSKSSADILAVHCVISEETLNRVVCVEKGKSYIFNLDTDPSMMDEGKLSDFLSSEEKPMKIFSGLDSDVCAFLFDKYEIVLDGSKMFDVKVAYDMVLELGIGNLDDLKAIKYDPENEPSNPDSITEACLTYLEAYSYLNSANISKGEMKAVRQKKKDAKDEKSPSKGQSQGQKKKGKKK